MESDVLYRTIVHYFRLHYILALWGAYFNPPLDLTLTFKIDRIDLQLLTDLDNSIKRRSTDAP